MKSALKGYLSIFLSALAPAAVDGLHAVINAVPDAGIYGMLIKLGGAAILGAVGGRILHQADPPNQPLAVASGQAMQNAGKGPFVR